MEHTLVLMRHAKAGDSASSDFDRNLTVQGQLQAVEVGRILASQNIDYAIVSAAKRAKETFGALGLQIPVEYHRVLYLGGVDVMVSRIGEMEESVKNLLVVAHAPDIPQLASRLMYWAGQTQGATVGAGQTQGATVGAGQTQGATVGADQLQCGFSTADYARFSISSSWASFAEDFLELRPLTGIKSLGGTAVQFSS